MCFSASASFVSAACIAGIGSLANNRVQNKTERPLAVIPILFACQQAIEGFIWLCFKHSAYTYYLPFLAKSFLFFAWVIWPLLVPWAVLKLETNRLKTKWIQFALVLGGLLAIISLFQLTFFHTEVYLAGSRIAYRIISPVNLNYLEWILQSMYVLCTLLPLMLSSVRGMLLLGITNLVSLLLSFLFFKEALPSVWCFFAAILSLLIVNILPVRSSN